MDVMDRVLEAARRGQATAIPLRLAEALLEAGEERALTTVGEPEIVTGPLVEQVAVAAVGAASWMWEPGGPRLLYNVDGVERRLVIITPPAQIGGGAVDAVTLGAGGSGYTSVPDVLFSGGGGAGADAEAVLGAAAVASITVTNGGSGYTDVPGVTKIGGGGGTGGSFTVLLTPTSVTRIEVTNGGSGYTDSTTSATIAGSARIRDVEVTSGEVTHIVLDAVGGGYTSPPVVTITDTGGGTGATAVAVLRATSIASVTVTDGGSGYTEPPEIQFTGGGGSGATAVAALAARAVASIRLLDGGGGYTTAPTVTISGGGGSGATATATIATQEIVAEGAATVAHSPAFSSQTLSYEYLRPEVQISTELLEDADMAAQLVGAALGAEISATIEQHLVMDPTDGILGSANYTRGSSEPQTGGPNSYNSGQPLGGANEQQIWRGLADCLQALPQLVRADPRLCFLMTGDWHDEILLTTVDTSRANVFEWTHGPYNVPVKLLGVGPNAPAAARDRDTRFAAVGVWPMALVVAFVGQAELVVDPYSLAHQGLVRLYIRQRYAASKWNPSYYATLLGPDYR